MLQIQRKLQLQIEKQGEYLQRLIEKQGELMEDSNVKATSTLSNAGELAPMDGKTEVSGVDHVAKGQDIRSDASSLKNASQDVNKRKMVSDAIIIGDDDWVNEDPCPSSIKRLRGDD